MSPNPPAAAWRRTSSPPAATSSPADGTWPSPARPAAGSPPTWPASAYRGCPGRPGAGPAPTRGTRPGASRIWSPAAAPTSSTCTRPRPAWPGGSRCAADGALRRASIAWERVAARRTELFVCVGAAEVEQGRAMGVRGRYTVVRNGLDLDRFPPADDRDRTAARRRLGVDPAVPLAVCVGRVTRQKGQDMLVSAWHRVRRHCPDAELSLVGDGDLLPALRATPVPGVRFAGAVTDVRPWLVAADLVVLPSRWEGLPLTALEALATGRCVVASAVPGLAELLAPGAGALVAPEDPAALAGALALRLRDPARTGAEGVAAARHARQFDIRRTFDRLATATQRVAATTHREVFA